jgi:hypothetical protein
MLKDKASESIQELHEDRLNRYASKQHMTKEKAVIRLVQLHRSGINIAEHISSVIKDDHMKYTNTLQMLGEYQFFIR